MKGRGRDETKSQNTHFMETKEAERFSEAEGVVIHELHSLKSYSKGGSKSPQCTKISLRKQRVTGDNLERGIWGEVKAEGVVTSLGVNREDMFVGRRMKEKH